jgi:hypothetical protein
VNEPTPVEGHGVKTIAKLLNAEGGGETRRDASGLLVRESGRVARGWRPGEKSRPRKIARLVHCQAFVRAKGQVRCSTQALPNGAVSAPPSIGMPQDDRPGISVALVAGTAS